MKKPKRILRHKVAKFPVDREKMNALTYDDIKDKIFLNMNRSQHSVIEGILSKKGIYSSNDRIGTYTIAYSLDKNVIWIYCDSTASINEVEEAIYNNKNFLNSIDDKMISSYYSIERVTSDLDIEIQNSENVLKDLKFRYNNESVNLNQNKIFREILIKRAFTFKDKYNFKDGRFNFYFKDVIAEDTEAYGEDIKLGGLKFELSLSKKTIYLTEGDYPYRTDYNENAFHPHMLSEGTLCFGTMETDILDAINSLDLDVLNILLYKFAHTYSSNDSAGAHWRLWDEQEMYNDEDRIWVERTQQSYDEEDVTWSEYLDAYVPNEESVWSECMSSSLYSDDDECVMLYDLDYSMLGETIELLDGRYAHKDDSTIVSYNDNFYTEDQMIFSEIDQEDIPLDDAVESEDGWILEENSIKLEDGTIRNEETYKEELAILTYKEEKEEVVNV